jgi:predicted lipid-binding transport protein (Tim44 family)
MNDTFDIYTLLFLVLAIVIFLRLRNVLGRRTGNERQPSDPYSARDAKPNGSQGGNDKVVALPSRTDAHKNQKQSAEDVEEHLKKFAPKNSALWKALTAIMNVDPDFDPEHFIQGAKAAYEMIVMAFAEGNKRTLKQLLGMEVYEGFVAALDDRAKKSETVESSFVGISKADIIEAGLKDKLAQVTVKFVSELITATRDQEGRIIDGDPNKIREVTDIWTFGREVNSRDPNWKLIATEAAN